jgi:hypothetical protein
MGVESDQNTLYSHMKIVLKIYSNCKKNDYKKVIEEVNLIKIHNMPI